MEIALEKEKEITRSQVANKHRTARNHAGEPIYTSLLQASLEQCERESAGRHREIIGLTANAVRALRKSSSLCFCPC